jgi:hypothetical protein
MVMTDIEMAPEFPLRRGDGRAIATAKSGDAGLAPSVREGATNWVHAPQILASQTTARSHGPIGWRFRTAAAAADPRATPRNAGLRAAMHEEATHGDRHLLMIASIGMPPLPIETCLDRAEKAMHLRAPTSAIGAGSALEVSLPPLTGGDLHRIGHVGGSFARRMPNAGRRAAAVAEFAPTEACR